MSYREVTQIHTFHNATTTNAFGVPMEVADYQNVVVAVTGTNATVLFQGAIQDSSDAPLTAPDFTAASSATNQWAYMDVVDYQDDSKNPGNTGIAITTAVTRIFEFNTNGLSWVNIQVSGNTGTVTARGKAYSTN